MVQRWWAFLWENEGAVGNKRALQQSLCLFIDSYLFGSYISLWETNKNISSFSIKRQHKEKDTWLCRLPPNVPDCEKIAYLAALNPWNTEKNILFCLCLLGRQGGGSVSSSPLQRVFRDTDSCPRSSRDSWGLQWTYHVCLDQLLLIGPQFLHL